MMKLYAVNDYILSIEGNQSDGWSPSFCENARKLYFNFEIEELEKGGGFLLLAYSQNEEVYTDTWHETVEAAMEAANEEFGISIDLWKVTK